MSSGSQIGAKEVLKNCPFLIFLQTKLHIQTSSSPPAASAAITSRWWEEAAYQKLKTTYNVNDLKIILRSDFFQAPDTAIKILSKRSATFLNAVLSAVSEKDTRGTMWYVPLKRLWMSLDRNNHHLFQSGMETGFSQTLSSLSMLIPSPTNSTRVFA